MDVSGIWPARRQGEPSRPRRGRLSSTAQVRPRQAHEAAHQALQPGEIALIDHEDIDRVSGEDLVAQGVSCVLNVAESSSRRLPQHGPSIIADAGVHLVDVARRAALRPAEGRRPASVVRGDKLFRDDEPSSGAARSRIARPSRDAYEAGQRGIGEALERVRREHDQPHPRGARAALRQARPARASTPLPRPPGARGRARRRPPEGPAHPAQLRARRKPVLIGVDGGADALARGGLQARHDRRRHGLGQRRACSRCGAELVVHAYPDGRAPGRERLDALGARLQGRRRRRPPARTSRC